MTSPNHTNNRELQQDAHAWAAFAGVKYTTALRQIQSPLAQGILGERLSARRLIAVLTEHPVLSRSGVSFLGENGLYSDAPWSLSGPSDFLELALIADALRMFTPIAASARPDVSSYSLKHTAENFLAPHCSYVSNGRLIWVAAALGLFILAEDEGSPNVAVGVSELEHDYVQRMSGYGGCRCS